MKHFNIFALASAIVVASAVSVHSQERTLRIDTTWRYTYESDTDSTFRSAHFHYFLDSANIKETITFNRGVVEGAWESGSKYREIWDSSGHQDSTISYTWDAGAEQWDENGLTEMFVDAYGNDTLFRVSQKSGEDWIGILAIRTECSYDENDHLVQEILYTGLPGEESEFEKFEYTPDASGNSISTLRYNFETDWVLYQRIDASYDDQGRSLEETVYSRNGEEWSEQAKIVCAYDSNGNLLEREYYEWNGTSSAWAMTGLYQISYNADGEWILRMTLAYSMDGELLGTGRESYFYDLSGKLEIHSSTYVDETTGLYTYNQKQFYRHAGDYFVLLDSICAGEQYVWDGESIPAGGIYRKKYTSVAGLDSMYVLSLTEHPLPASFGIDGPLEVALDEEALYIADENGEVEYAWTVVNGTVLSGADNDSLRVRWESSGTGEVAAWAMNEFFCSSDTVSMQVTIGALGLEDPVEGQWILYPVPVRDHLVIESAMPFGRVELLDTKGRLVLSSGESTQRLDLSSLESGIYLVRLFDRHGTPMGTRKILKE